MGNHSFHDVVKHLTQLQLIYETLNLSKKEMKVIEEMVDVFKTYGDKDISDICIEQTHTEKMVKKSKKVSFLETLELIKQKEYEMVKGVKIRINELNTPEKIMSYIEENPPDKVLGDSTVLDLKILYAILTEENREVRGTKKVIYETIKANIRARKRGIAFSKM